jgi:hypothetical protein
MKKFIAPLAPVLCTYVAFSFIAWNPNPGEWDPFGRFMMAFIGGFAGLAISLESYFGILKK